MSHRRWVVGVALLSLALLCVVIAPHGHLPTGGPSQDDCVLCHAHHTPVIESHSFGELPELAAGLGCAPAPTPEERAAALGNHPSRAPPV